MSNVTQLQLNLPLPEPKTLADKAMLVRLSRGIYQPYAYDAVATSKVEQDNQVTKAGRFNKHLLKESVWLKSANAAMSAIYTYHHRVTLPWLDDGLRLLPSAMYFEYTQEIRRLRDEADKAVDALAQHWQQEIANDANRLGPLFKVEDYPTDIKSRYYCKVQFLPVPSTDDFRVHVSEEDRQSLHQAVYEAEHAAVEYVLAELLEPLRRAAEKLAVPIGAEGSVFRDTLVENIVEVSERMAKLNISDDAALAAAINDVHNAFAPYTKNIDALRVSQEVRTQAQKKALAQIDMLAEVFK